VPLAPDWLRDNYWDDARLLTEFRRALGLTDDGQLRAGSPP
jgi:hypothetical protein